MAHSFNRRILIAIHFLSIIKSYFLCRSMEFKLHFLLLQTSACVQPLVALVVWGGGNINVRWLKCERTRSERVDFPFSLPLSLFLCTTLFFCSLPCCLFKGTCPPCPSELQCTPLDIVCDVPLYHDLSRAPIVERERERSRLLWSGNRKCFPAWTTPHPSNNQHRCTPHGSLKTRQNLRPQTKKCLRTWQASQ